MADDALLGSIERYGEAKGERAVKERIEAAMDEAERKAIHSLARYKFQMFGYWAAVWVHLNRIGQFQRRNPFRFAVDAAKEYAVDIDEVVGHEPPEFPVYLDAQGVEHAEF